MYSKKGFTLIEILIVVFVISIAVAVVYPVSVKILDKYQKYLKDVEKKHLVKKERFIKFLTDEK